jgi:hydroxymethylpyrimidine pyrophosphatase-like HAD family hydrolase
MIAVDLDGTLLNSRKRISDEDRNALRLAAARGVEIVPVTGRNYSTALPIVAELLASGPLIASNGAIIRSKEGETHLRGLLPVSVAAEVLRSTPKFRHYTVVTYDQHGEGQFRIEVSAGNGTGREGSLPVFPPDGVAASPWIERYRDAVRFTESLEHALDGDPVEIMFAGPVALMREVEARLGSMREAADTIDFRLLRTEYPERNFSIVDVIRHDCSKGHAVEFWSRYRGFAREEVMAIGDNYNDLEMLRFAGTPVVMGNAEEAVKQEGGREGWPVTLDCDSGGVARAVEEYVLGE